MRNSNPLSIYFILQKINDTNQSNLSKLQQHAVYLLNINNIVIGLLPIILRPWCRVANIRKSIMVLETANASWLMRLRHEKTQLLYNLRSKILPSLSYIDIRIQPSLAIKRNISRSKPYSVLFNGKIE
ncbi:MAG: DUF721 domain-containing protein, partial [Candidatus Baumannia cicadellinicola]|nr:DUF721 domain-containing protein [Candidatus Baumannia cicadellinicola]